MECIKHRIKRSRSLKYIVHSTHLAMSEMRLLQDYGGFWLQYNKYVVKIQRYTCVLAATSEYKQNEHHVYKTEKWTVRGKNDNLKKEMQKNTVAVIDVNEVR
jgi:hypothetical protein